MRDIEFHKPIASRRYTFAPRKGRSYPVTVSIGKPYSRGRPAQWLCRYRITGAGKVRTLAMAGADSMQALLLAAQILRVELELWARTEKGKFLYDGQPKLFLPVLTAGRRKTSRRNAN